MFAEDKAKIALGETTERRARETEIVGKKAAATNARAAHI